MRHETQHLTQEQLKDLRLPVGVEDARLALQVAMECAFQVTQPLLGKNAPDNHLRDAHHLIQVTLLRSASILHLSEGTPYPNGVNVHLPWSTAPDPISVWGLVRAQYEAFAVMSNVFSQHQDEEQDFLYSLWALAGLVNRAPLQEFIEAPQYAKYVKPEDKEAYERLLAEIEVEKEKFKGLPLFSKQTPKKQDEVIGRISRGQFQFIIEGGIPIWKGWQGLFMRSAKSDLFDSLYSSMSLWAHPSNAGVRHFSGMYGSAGDYQRQLEYALCLAALILAMTVQEQIQIFSDCRTAYEALSQSIKDLLEHWNITCRTGSSKSILSGTADGVQSDG